MSVEDQWDEVGRAVDTLENLIAGQVMPMPDRLHLEGLRGALPPLRDRLKAAYIQAVGSDPWELPDEGGA